jgi:hypothetical protein
MPQRSDLGAGSAVVAQQRLQFLQRRVALGLDPGESLDCGMDVAVHAGARGRESKCRYSSNST